MTLVRTIQVPPMSKALLPISEIGPPNVLLPLLLLILPPFCSTTTLLRVLDTWKKWSVALLTRQVLAGFPSEEIDPWIPRVPLRTVMLASAASTLGPAN